MPAIVVTGEVAIVVATFVVTIITTIIICRRCLSSSVVVVPIKVAQYKRDVATQTGRLGVLF